VLGRSKRLGDRLGLEDIIKMDPREIECQLDWFSVNIVIYFEQANCCTEKVILVATETPSEPWPHIYPDITLTDFT
jgi:hypothetical protein